MEKLELVARRNTCNITREFGYYADLHSIKIDEKGNVTARVYNNEHEFKGRLNLGDFYSI